MQTLCATQNPKLSDIAVNGTNLLWYNSNSSTNILPNTTPLQNGVTYYASQTVNGCESVNRTAISVTLINSLNATNYSTIICDNLNDGSEIIDLSSYNSNLISNSSNCTFEYYNSFSGATNQTNPDLISTITNYNLILGNNIIFIRITSSNGCYQVVELDINLVSEPKISIPNIVPICERNNILLDAGANFSSYLWSTGATNQSILVNQAGNYSITVTQAHGTTICSTTKNFNVVLSSIATISSIETQDWTDNENIIIVNTSGLGNYEFSLDGINYQSSNTFTGLNSGYYVVYIRDKNGCGIAEDQIFLLTYPKFFTPNGDGINDTWKIKFSQYESDFKVNIYDRFGKLIKSLNKSSSWDGTYDGNLMFSDDYWFVATRSDGREYKGHFTLKR